MKTDTSRNSDQNAKAVILESEPHDTSSRPADGWDTPWFQMEDVFRAPGRQRGHQRDPFWDSFQMGTVESLAGVSSAKKPNSFSEAAPGHQTLRPELFANAPKRVVTPFEVLSELRETLAQHVYLDGLRPWLRAGSEHARGGVSVIQFLDDELLQREVAMKSLDRHRGAPLQELGLLKEALVTGQLAHPNIPPVYDVWMSTSGECRFTMKRIVGRTLSEVLMTNPPGTRTRAEFDDQLGIIVKICDALSYAHDFGVLHRDVKPANIMVGDHGEVFLMDWGCALVSRRKHFPRKLRLPQGLVEALKCQDDAVVGTPSFMSPEQAFGNYQTVSQRSDVYLLGGLLFFVLTGVAPRAGIQGAQAAIRAAQAGFVNNPFNISPQAELPAKLVEVARRALDPDPRKRFADAHEFKRHLELAQRDGMWHGNACYATGQHIYREGDVGDAVYLIIEGEVELYRMRSDKKVKVSNLTRGEVFGMSAFEHNGKRSQNADALCDVTLLRVPKEVFQDTFVPGSGLHQIIQALTLHHQNARTRI